jgi:hypothetical protein
MPFSVSRSTAQIGRRDDPHQARDGMMFPPATAGSSSLSEMRPALYSKAVNTPATIENAWVFAEILRTIGSGVSDFAVPTGTVTHVGGKPRAGVIRWISVNADKLHIWGDKGQALSLMGLRMPGELDLQTLMVRLPDDRVVSLQELTEPQRDATLSALRIAAVLGARNTFSATSRD